MSIFGDFRAPIDPPAAVVSRRLDGCAVTSLAVFALNATADLGRTIAQELWVSLAPHEEREFEDGEHKARPLDSVEGADTYVIQSRHST